MEEITGVLKTLGEATTTANRAKSIYANVYTFIEIGDEHITKLAVPQGINGILMSCLEVDAPVTLYLASSPFTKQKALYAIKRADGRVFAADLGGWGNSKLGLIVTMAPLGIVSIPFLGLGFFILWQLANLMLEAGARDAAKAIPGAVLI